MNKDTDEALAFALATARQANVELPRNDYFDSLNCQIATYKTVKSRTD